MSVLMMKEYCILQNIFFFTYGNDHVFNLYFINVVYHIDWFPVFLTWSSYLRDKFSLACQIWLFFIIFLKALSFIDFVAFSQPLFHLFLKEEVSSNVLWNCIAGRFFTIWVIGKAHRSANISENFTSILIRYYLYFHWNGSSDFVIIALFRFFFHFDSILVGCMFLELYPFLLSYPIFQHIHIHSSLLHLHVSL